MGIELLNEINKDYIFENVPKENKENKVFMKINSLRSKTIWYVLENKGSSICCIIKDGSKELVKRNVHLWEFWENDCYIDKSFIPKTINKLMLG